MNGTDYLTNNQRTGESDDNTLTTNENPITMGEVRRVGKYDTQQALELYQEYQLNENRGRFD